MINNLKSEKGSITVFVLASCLFFLISTVGVQVYTKNKQTALEKDYIQIKESYEKDLGNQGILYNKLKDVSKSGKIEVNFESQEGYLIPTGEGSTDITQKITIDNGTNKQIRQISYGWSNTAVSEPGEWAPLPTNNLTYLVTKRGATEGDHYLWVKIADEDLNEHILHMQSAITVYNQDITIDKSGANAIITYPNDVTIYNKKVGQGANENEAKNNKVNNVNSSVTINSNYVYAEATDSHGNKIYKNVFFSMQSEP